MNTISNSTYHKGDDFPRGSSFLITFSRGGSHAFANIVGRSCYNFYENEFAGSQNISLSAWGINLNLIVGSIPFLDIFEEN